MKEKFTKGDWQVALMDDRTRIVIESENTGYAVADIIDVSDTDRANAALIAAAPDMYAMLKDIAEKECGNTPTLLEINALLAKARGEQ